MCCPGTAAGRLRPARGGPVAEVFRHRHGFGLQSSPALPQAETAGVDERLGSYLASAEPWEGFVLS